YLTGRRKLEKRYTLLKRLEPEGTLVWETILELLKVEMAYDEAQFQKIPTEGPVVFIANHPFGVLDGLVLSCLISRVRPDFKVMVNEVLTREPLLAPYLLPIDFRPTKAAMDMNIQTRKDTLLTLKAGQALGIFPAGGVATAHKGSRKVEDLEWKLFVAKAVQMSGATVVPIFFHGQNSRLFQLASRINMNLRLGLLLNEVRNKMGDTVQLAIGDPIPPETWKSCADRKELLEFLRNETFALSRGAHA
ncbi:MAG: lysophospholipid acyltransferase family protein, partial [Phaeodactylibacter sp.]|nr:lysophospholipid acyltransferase family protein [Phaeodactylibacter sp.]